MIADESQASQWSVTPIRRSQWPPVFVTDDDDDLMDEPIPPPPDSSCAANASVDQLDDSSPYRSTSLVSEAEIEDLEELVSPWTERNEPVGTATSPLPLGDSARFAENALERCRRYLEGCPDSVSGNGGHDAAFHAACICFRFGLTEEQALTLMHRYNEKKSTPMWTARELEHKLKDARAAVMKEGQFGIFLRDGTTVRKDACTIIPFGHEPMRCAESLLERRFTRNGAFILRRWRDEWYHFNGVVYERISDEKLGAIIRQHFDGCQTYKVGPDGEMQLDRRGEKILKKMVPNGHFVDEVKAALPSYALLPEVDPPFWTGQTRGVRGLGGSDETPPPANEMVALQNGLLHLPTCTFTCHTPLLFNLNAVPFDYNPEAPEPRKWLEFLKSLFDDDEGSCALLQEWFGYCLLPDTCQQKILLVIGPPRAGKGTIARVLQGILGVDNCCSPTLASLGMEFGLQPLLGKQLAVISDARLSGRTDAAVVLERLLSISGEDVQTVNRKFLSPVTTRLPVHIMILSNELPRLPDSSGAISSRMLLLTLKESFLGRENPHLSEQLDKEFPGIFNWALDGYALLRERGYFVQPSSAKEALDQLAELTSPVSTFVRECCEIRAGAVARTDHLYRAWLAWCYEQGREHPGDKLRFLRDLKAAIPRLKRIQMREGENRFGYMSGIVLRE